MDIGSTSAVLMPFLSVTAFVAYKHPAAYKVLYILISLVLLVSFILLAAWDMSSMHTSSALYSYHDRAKLDEAKRVADALIILDWKLWVGWFSLNLYLGFLNSLPSLGIVARDDTKEAPASEAPSRAP